MSKVDNKKREKQKLSGDIDFASIVDDKANTLLSENKTDNYEGILFFCRNCRKIIDGMKYEEGKKKKDLCPECKDPLVKGTKKSLYNYYKI